jgi:hypothetical protein
VGAIRLFFDEAIEVWRAVYSGKYEVSNFGRARRAMPARNSAVGRILPPQLSRNRRYVGYNFYDGHKVHFKQVHRIVARLFLGEPEGWEDLEVNHKDGNGLNPHVDNLEWCTSSENMLHAYATGLKQGRKGMACCRAKLTDDDVREIRNAVASGRSQYGLANEYGVTNVAINAIVHRRTWKHIA